MSFSASQKNINEILSRNTVYIIPKNQRKYVWTENEWNELYEDVFLIDQSQNYNHFLGSVVFAKESTSNQYSIIDGQQRLTTLCLLILAISNHLYKLGNEKTPKSFINTFLKGNNNGDEYYKIERKDGPFFLTSLIDDLSQFKGIDTIKSSFDSFFGATDRYNSKLLECFIHFYTKIDNDLNNSQKKNDRLIELKDRIINCEVIEIIVEKDVDGYRVFETLNARGIPLEQHELIKNYLYSYLRTKPKVQKLDNSWAKILENVTSKDIDFFSLFISHYCTHIYGKTKKNEEFRAIRENTPKSNVEGLLTSLVKNSQYYSFFLDPHSLKDTIFYDDKIELSLKYFKDLNIRQVRPLLLSLFDPDAEAQAPAAGARPQGQRPAGGGFGGGFGANAGFEKFLCDELVPYVDAHFRTIANKDNRAMAGLSMGGMETHSITLARPEMFGYYGLLSGGQYNPSEIQDKKQVKKIFMSCGSKESPDAIMNAAKTMKEAGFDAMGYVSEGTAHEFLTWRRSLYQMAQFFWGTGK